MIVFIKRTMEENTGETEGAETITDIQNYLASFNKEIQDGGTAAATTAAAQLEAVTEANSGAEQGTETAFFVAAPGTASAEGFQYEQGEVLFIYFFLYSLNILKCLLVMLMSKYLELFSLNFSFEILSNVM